MQNDEINAELTLEAQNDEKYKRYIQWLKENGALYENINFPVAFGPTGYIGVTAKDDIPANKVIVVIPNNLLLSTYLVEQCELNIILEENPILFDIEEDDDAQFNKLALYLMKEKLKGKDSFWYPYLSIAPESFTLLDWKEEEVQKTGDQYLYQQYKEFRNSMFVKYNIFEKVLKKYSEEIFPIQNLTFQLFKWAYQFCITRCYGWNFPHTLLVPLADAFNHSKEGNTNLLFNLKIEKGEIKQPKNYILKHNKVDFSIFKEFNYSSNEFDKIYQTPNIKNDYIQVLSEPNTILKDRNQEQEIIRKINGQTLKNGQKNLWELPYFTTSETEDNDTQESDENLEKNKKFVNLKMKENLAVQQNLQKNLKEDTIYEYIENYKNISREILKESKYKTSLSENNWDWYNPTDPNNYFTVSNWRKIQKDQQIFHCYGRRNNRYLLNWYGFCMKNNPYDSFPFRIYLKEDNITKSVFTNYISEHQQEKGIVPLNGKNVNFEDFTKEFRLKKTKLCLDFLSFLRFRVLKKLNQNIKVTVPQSLSIEILIFQESCQVFQTIMDIFNNQKCESKEYFAQLLREEQACILQTNLNLSKLVLEILVCVDNTKDLKSAVQNRYEQWEKNDEEYNQNRERIRHYIHMLYFCIFKQKV